MVTWRFDQGRLDYFQFDEVRSIAKALVLLDGTTKPVKKMPDNVRVMLRSVSTLPFAPENYFVWRNYARVFGCQLLATEVNGQIVVTELCKRLVREDLDFEADDYFFHLTKNFCYPSPIFAEYNSSSSVTTYPFIAVIKFLISKVLYKSIHHVSVDEIARYLIGNKVTGLEDLQFYSNLKDSGHVLHDDQKRQLREMLRFISQFSFLKWENPYLYLELANKEELFELEKGLSPRVRARVKDPAIEILEMGSSIDTTILDSIVFTPAETLEEEFVEGKKVRVTHLRSERSSKLKQLYFNNISNPELCDMCSMNTREKYPWSEHTIELHHLLPLCSPVRVESGKTSLKDLVGLCPSCHRATHKYYSLWLKNLGLKDFRSYTEARGVYVEAKDRVRK